ncbi:hypothetical protein BURKHO8Y_510023 [Burkholderia sp. 8Y]|nr:hypothetical protein BURKHO8Y_510023 [Burkholderia sp. 8Y]
MKACLVCGCGRTALSQRCRQLYVSNNTQLVLELSLLAEFFPQTLYLADNAKRLIVTSLSRALSCCIGNKP